MGILGERITACGSCLLGEGVNYDGSSASFDALTSVELAVVGNHEHDLPFKGVTVYQPDADALYAVFRLHKLVLFAQEEGRA